ncbi:MAG: glycosyltransferase [Bacteroidales bacterium]|nr:glycosyltransferase [Bacteroidales bacterium]
MNTPKISVIVPVYKAEAFLRKCLDSVVSQDYSDWECILVDDGSPDCSGEICEEYAAKDSRFKVFHKTNGGASSARNLGLDNARGEWIVFLDADDSFQSEYLKTIYNYIGNADLAICGFNVGGMTFIPDINEGTLLKLRDYSSRKVLINDYYSSTVWAKLFKRKLIESVHLIFDESICLSEDTIFTREYLFQCDTVCLVPYTLYNYTGFWGGDKSKYLLSEYELCHSLKCQFEIVEKINNKFGWDIRHDGIFPQLDKLKDIFALYSDADIYRLYTQIYGYVPFVDFLESNLIPLALSNFYERISDFADGRYGVACCILSEYRKFFATEIHIAQLGTIKKKAFYLLIKKAPVSITSLLLVIRKRFHL